ncbi:glycosyltransferase family 39 protein [Conexibacter sp. DBS9H8]|uniref:glycosyltransferase family 39 protein n=1 Tax=Conexibacter sp. DBS9H8 TaxID=2937801 RepID=UPI00200D4550|nr:glycosyltransferase family 39 protein [Conexibacter sp. DBS9H8]
MSATSSTPAEQPTRIVREFKLWMPGWLQRWPEWLRVTAFLVLLTALSAFMRTRYLNGQFWMDEALAVGIASHPLTAIPGILRYDGSPPLYYMLLHLWMGMLGDGETATHTLSAVFGISCVPISYWGVWTIFKNKRMAMMAAVLFAFNAFLTQYSQETRMYSMMAFLGLFATIGFIAGFVQRRRKYVILFAVAQALMLYTHAWGLFYGAGSFISLAILWRLTPAEERTGLVKDALMAYVAVAVLFLPWLPTFIFQSTHTGAPWDSSPRFGAPVQLSQNLIGADSATAALVLCGGVGLADLFVRKGRNTPTARIMWMFFSLVIITLGLAWIASQITPAWVPRYFAPIVAPLLILGAMGLSRAGVLGAISLLLVVIFLANPASFTPQYKSDMQDVAGELGPDLHKGDLVIVGQPEQTPLAYYYLPDGHNSLVFANTMQGIDRQPTYMDWINAIERYRAANPWKVLPPILNALKPGQQVLFIRPMTEGALNWKAPWTELVRLRSAQWGEIIASDKQLVQEPGKWAPHNYFGACCVADSAVLYKKV